MWEGVRFFVNPFCGKTQLSSQKAKIKQDNIAKGITHICKRQTSELVQ